MQVVLQNKAKTKFFSPPAINQMEISTGLLGGWLLTKIRFISYSKFMIFVFPGHCLKPSKTASFQCRLKPSQRKDKPLPQDILKTRLSYMDIIEQTKTPNHLEQNIPKMSELYSFLANNETVYFNTSITTEEFNNIVASYEPHTTIAICWTAAIVQNSVQRTAFGQHFVQLRNIYEKRTCPAQPDEIKQFKSSHLDREQQKQFNIQQFWDKLPQEINTLLLDTEGDKATERYLPFGDDDDFWETNETYVGQRCLLEDESFLITSKA